MFFTVLYTKVAFAENLKKNCSIFAIYFFINFNGNIQVVIFFVLHYFHLRLLHATFYTFFRLNFTLFLLCGYNIRIKIF